MEPGRTEIINMALLFCNQDTILNSDGETKNEKLCDMFFDTTLDEALSGHPWSFALVAAQLQLLAKKPRDFRFKYTYQLPDNFGRIQQVISKEQLEPFNYTLEYQDIDRLYYGHRADTHPVPEYIVQGKEVYTNYRDLQIVYTRTDVLPKQMTPQFRNYFAALLASKLYLKITGGVDGFNSLQSKVIQLKAEAANTDGEQMDTLTPNRPFLFLSARMY